jgi:hypothetical protein
VPVKNQQQTQKVVVQHPTAQNQNSSNSQVAQKNPVKTDTASAVKKVTPAKKIADTVILTNGFIKEHEITRAQLDSLDFFVGPAKNIITLRKKHTDYIDTVENGCLVLTTKISGDSIIINPFAQAGKLVKYNLVKDTLLLAVSFEKDSLGQYRKDLYLIFQANINDLEAGFKLNFFYSKKGEAKTNYGEHSYRLRTSVCIPQLYFVLDTKIEYDFNVRVIDGTEVIPSIQQQNIQTPQNQTQPVQQKTSVQPVQKVDNSNDDNDDD